MKSFNYNWKTGIWDPSPVGELVYCKNEKLKYFLKNQIYKIEKASVPPPKKEGEIRNSYYRRGNDGKIKLEGVKGYHSYSNFTFVENNVALYRDVQINQIMDIQCHHGKNSERIINTLPSKEKTLLRILALSISKSLEKGVKGIESLDDLIDYAVKENIKYNVIKEDFLDIGNISLKDFIDKAFNK